MLTKQLRDSLLAGLQDGSIVPYLGPGVLADVRNAATGAPMPATSDALIIAMNGGKPMSPKLMYEFPRAAMNVELKRGRTAVTKFLDATYATVRDAIERSGNFSQLCELMTTCGSAMNVPLSRRPLALNLVLAIRQPLPLKQPCGRNALLGKPAAIQPIP